VQTESVGCSLPAVPKDTVPDRETSKDLGNFCPKARNSICKKLYSCSYTAQNWLGRTQECPGVFCLPMTQTRRLFSRDKSSWP